MSELSDAFIVGAVAVFYLMVYKRINAADFKSGRLPISSNLGKFEFLYKLIILSTFLVSVLACTPLKSCALLFFPASLYLKLVAAVIILFSLWYFKSALRAVGEEYSPCYDLYQPLRFISGGVYRWVRHPIYAANLYLLFGLLVLLPSAIILINLFLLFAFYYKAALLEEENLLRAFPEYLEYRRHTKMFFPFI